jgi:hypothetical protein
MHRLVPSSLLKSTSGPFDCSSRWPSTSKSPLASVRSFVHSFIRSFVQNAKVEIEAVAIVGDIHDE